VVAQRFIYLHIQQADVWKNLLPADKTRYDRFKSCKWVDFQSVDEVSQLRAILFDLSKQVSAAKDKEANRIEDRDWFTHGNIQGDTVLICRLHDQEIEHAGVLSPEQLKTFGEEVFESLGKGNGFPDVRAMAVHELHITLIHRALQNVNFVIHQYRQQTPNGCSDLTVFPPEWELDDCADAIHSSWMKWYDCVGWTHALARLADVQVGELMTPVQRHKALKTAFSRLEDEWERRVSFEWDTIAVDAQLKILEDIKQR